MKSTFRVKGNNPPLTWDLNWDSHLVGHVEKYLKCYSARLNSLTPRRNLNLQRRNSEPKELGGRCVVAVARTTSSVGRRWPISSQQLECDWLAPCRWVPTVHSNSLLYFSVILRNPWFSLGNNKCFWKENEKLYCENYWQCFRKNDGGGLFPLIEIKLLTLMTPQAKLWLWQWHPACIRKSQYLKLGWLHHWETLPTYHTKNMFLCCLLQYWKW